MPDPNKIEGGRWDRVLRNLFNLKGYGSTAARIADDISPTFNFPWRLEDEFLLDERLCWGRASAVAPAANFPMISLTNASDNQLVIVEKLWIIAAANNTFIQVQGGVIPNLPEQAKLPRDTRYGNGDVDLGVGVVNYQAGFTAVVHASTNVIQTVPYFADTTLTGFREVPCGVVLVPGQHFIVFSDLANSFIQLNTFWREHKAEPGELPPA